ncbi:DUF742 domain-containing protein [Streptomyces sp. NPDC051644]|uniref:DUF742 domain-containing protein n=1 Tax=Streptomyces sp. NPDC051644 TaxID=3365666 RepID=UPI0037B93B09
MSVRGHWSDSALGDIRPYTLTGGRTHHPNHQLGLTSRLVTRPAARRLPTNDVESEALLMHCSGAPCSVAELAGRLHQPVQVVKVLIGDLMDAEALTLANPARPADPNGPDTDLLEALLHGLRTRL